MIHFHRYKESHRYLLVTGEDMIWYECAKCGKEKYAYSSDTLLGLAHAPTYKEWYENELKKRINEFNEEWKVKQESARAIHRRKLQR